MAGDRVLKRVLDLELLYGIDHVYLPVRLKAKSGDFPANRDDEFARSKLKERPVPLRDKTYAGGGPWELLRREALSCVKCGLHAGRSTVVFGEGNAESRIVFVGEAPGEEEDRTGRPFVGKAGQVLREVIREFIPCENVYIANIIKCRPAGNRLPSRSEISSCLPYLLKQLTMIKPRIICCLGATSTAVLLGKQSVTMNPIRGKLFDVPYGRVFVTFHPSYILRRGLIDLPIFKNDIKNALLAAGVITA